MKWLVAVAVGFFLTAQVPTAEAAARAARPVVAKPGAKTVAPTCPPRNQVSKN